MYFIINNKKINVKKEDLNSMIYANDFAVKNIDIKGANLKSKKVFRCLRIKYNNEMRALCEMADNYECENGRPDLDALRKYFGKKTSYNTTEKGIAFQKKYSLGKYDYVSFISRLYGEGSEKYRAKLFNICPSNSRAKIVRLTDKQKNEIL